MMDNSLDNNLTDLPQTNGVDKIETRVLDEHQISLLEEKLVVKRQKHKVGEVVVRKVVETRMIHLPIRREKLVIEKAGTANEYLTEVDLGEGQVNGVKFSQLGNTNDIYLSRSNFVSIESAQQLLSAINEYSARPSVKVRLEIVSDSSDSQTAYQQVCDRY